MSKKRVSTAVHVLLPAMVLLSLLALAFPGSSAGAETRVNSLDPDIQAAVSQPVDKPAGDIYQSDLADQTGNISSLSGLSDPSELDSLLGQLVNTSSASGFDRSELDSMLDQIVNTGKSSGLGDLSELDPMIDLIVNFSSLSSPGDLSGLGSLLNQTQNISSISSLSDLSGLNFSRNQISDISPKFTLAPAGKKNIWLIVGPIAMVTVIALLVDGFLTLRRRKALVPPTPMIGQNEVDDVESRE